MYAFRPMSRDCSTLKKKYATTTANVIAKPLKMCGQSCIITTAAMLRVRYNKFFAAQRVVIDEAHRFKSHEHRHRQAYSHVATAIDLVCYRHASAAHYAGRVAEHYTRRANGRTQRTRLLSTGTHHAEAGTQSLEECGHLQRIPELNNECMCEPSTMYQRVFPKYTDDVLVSLREGDFNKRAVRQMVADLEQMCIHTDCVPLYRYGTKVDVDTASLDRIIATFKFDDSNKKRVKDTHRGDGYMCTLSGDLRKTHRHVVRARLLSRMCHVFLKKHTTKSSTVPMRHRYFFGTRRQRNARQSYHTPRPSVHAAGKHRARRG